MTVDHEVIVRGWEKETSNWMAKGYPTHGEAPSSTAQLGKAKPTRGYRKSLQRVSLREGVVPPGAAILQGTLEALWEVNGILGLSTRR